MALQKCSICFDDGGDLEYVLDTGKRKNMYIAIKNGTVTVKIPLNMKQNVMENFIRSKRDWIEKSLANSSSECPCLHDYSDGESFMFMGRMCSLCYYSPQKYSLPYFDDDKLMCAVLGDCTDSVKSTVIKALDEIAVGEIKESMERLSKLTGLYPTKVTVKTMSGSWGRCSSEGAISINRRVADFSKDCIDYVVIHELCHLKYMNHSSDFWTLVEKYCPQRKQIRNIMRG